jgi:asparagine synthetase B (glutamine-hydrolysing)
MCEFVTTINFKDNKKIKSYLKSLKKINRHRCPDNFKLLDDDYSPVLFRRLSIIDISNNANQPFKSDDRKSNFN